MSEKYKKLFDQAEERIILGQIREAGQLLEKLRPARVPRAYLCRAAQIFRRAGLFDQAMRFLLPVVRPKAALLQPASDQEKAEYAICLQRCGSLEEARELLEHVSETAVPEVLLYKAIFFLNDWNTGAAAPCLEKLIASTSSDSYLNRVARLNLAVVYNTDERFAEAETLLWDLRRETSEREERLLYCNSLEVSAQTAVFLKKYKEADEFLTTAEAILTGSKTYDRLWLMKWRGILDAYTKGGPDAVKAARDEAAFKRHWETLREMDFMMCRESFDKDVFAKLYFGTHFEGYRKRLERMIRPMTDTKCYLTAGGVYRAEIFRPEGKILNVFSDLRGELSPGDLPHLMFLLLLSDAYRGLRTGQIHSRIFPGDYFNPYTSPDRIHQLVKRVRQELEAQIPGLEITHEQGVYKLDFSSFTGCFEIPRDFPPLRVLDVRLYALRERLHKDEFDRTEVQDALALSKASSNRVIAAWRDAGLIEGFGDQKRAFYKIKKAV